MKREPQSNTAIWVSLKNIAFPSSIDASIENSLHCLATALYLMIPPEVIAERMAHLEPIAMRLKVKEGKNGCVLINDSIYILTLRHWILLLTSWHVAQKTSTVSAR